jgi:hypothetical protein
MARRWHALALAGLMFFCRCDYTQGVKQVRSTADLQNITARISTSKSQGPGADVERIVAAAVESVHGGKDPWGHPYLWRVRESAKGVSYVVLSTGSDGQLDVPVIDEYFTRQRVDVLRASEQTRHRL